MEMDSIDDANGHTVLLESVSLSASPENSASTELSGNLGIYGEPEIPPRVGSEFQADIPDLEPVSKIREEADYAQSASIPLTWIIEESENEEGDLRCRRGREALGSELSDPKSVALERGKGARLVPGCSGNCIWSEIEKASFLLGLHVFGKNFVLVQRLSGVKGMGDVMSYYYGRYYGTEMYLRWRGCAKNRGRKCNYGQRIFAGSRHQELLSRLLLHASQECRDAVFEMSKAYGEGKILIEEYVFGLEANVGVSALVEAVGIGKGKRDLIGNPPETAARTRREIPAGKSLSSLAPKEILNILKGDFRLSKAKASDIFWESVWPRLLARGWHSEQPGTHLVYLRPGVDKFSRTELSKGFDYFDSVTDVLSLIAADPNLLEIDSDGGFTGETKGLGESKAEERRGPVEEEEERRRCYLKPRRTPIRVGSEFTVVDTSRPVVRALRSLPAKAPPPLGSGRSEEEDDDGDSSEVFDGDNNSPPKRAFSALLALPAQPKKVKKLAPREAEEGEEENRVFAGKRRKKKSSSSSTGSSGVAAVLDPNPQKRTFIDLNVPAFQNFVEIDEVLVIEEGPKEEEEEEEEASPEKSGRRQSTRNRPLTTRALEAIACGFMDEKKKRRKKTKESSPRPKKRARTKSPIGSEPEPVRADLIMDESQSSPRNSEGGDVLEKTG